MTSYIRDILAAQREIELARQQVMLYEESSIVRLAKEAQQAFLQQEQWLQATISPLRDELARHQNMMDEIEAIQLRNSAILDHAQFKSTVFADELLRNQRVLDEMRALSRPSLVHELHDLLPDRAIWHHIHEQQAAFESVRLQAAMVSRSFQDIPWAQPTRLRTPTLVA